MPTRVMPICTVARNWVGSSTRRNVRRAPRWPRSASTFRRARLDETIASSDIAKKPFSRMRRRTTAISNRSEAPDNSSDMVEALPQTGEALLMSWRTAAGAARKLPSACHLKSVCDEAGPSCQQANLYSLPQRVRLDLPGVLSDQWAHAVSPPSGVRLPGASRAGRCLVHDRAQIHHRPGGTERGRQIHTAALLRRARPAVRGRGAAGR